VVRSLAEAHRVERGDVLVAEFTDPGWTPLLERVSAVVTEVGGVLSHAAVIAREYGVPAVLSVRGATDAVADGAEVEVDGDAGEVRVLAP
jgi:phosphohistidine swiveling domain-containing protein